MSEGFSARYNTQPCFHGPKSQPGSLMSVGLGVETRAQPRIMETRSMWIWGPWKPDSCCVGQTFLGCLCLLSSHGIEVERSCRIAVSVPEAPFVGRLLLAATPIRLGPVRAERIRVRPAPLSGKGLPQRCEEKISVHTCTLPSPFANCAALAPLSSFPAFTYTLPRFLFLFHSFVIILHLHHSHSWVCYQRCSSPLGRTVKSSRNSGPRCSSFSAPSRLSC